MQAIQLTEPELDFVSSMVGAYRIRRLKAIAKSIRKSPSADLEAVALNSLITKLNALHLEALEVISPSTTDSTFPSPVVTHADVELPNIATVLDSLD